VHKLLTETQSGEVLRAAFLDGDVTAELRIEVILQLDGRPALAVPTGGGISAE
jgi:hypothetical protein